MKKFLQFDTLVQGIIGVIVIASLLASLITGDAWLIWGMLGWMLLGFWQVLSALITWLALGLKNRASYLLAVLVYGLLAAGITFLESRGVFRSEADWWFVVVFFILPIPFAIWYFRASLQAWKSDESPMPRSFWDLG